MRLMQTQLLFGCIAFIGLIVETRGDFCPPSSSQSDGMRDIMLIYGGPGKWRKENFLPYVAYLDKNGAPQDWFYDAYLFLMYGGAPSKNTYIDGTTNKADWEFFMAEEFAPDRELAGLDKAIGTVAMHLPPGGRRPSDTPVIIMIPYPSRKQRDFGDVDGDGQTEDFSSDAHRRKAVGWFLRSFLDQWRRHAFKNLKLWGFYWMNEGIYPGDEAIVKASAEEIHKLGYKFLWIPWFNAPGVAKWRELGFDLVIMQPNYAFMRPEAGLRIPDENRLTVAANQCRRLGMGIEMELNEGLFADPAYRLNLQLYLDHGDPALDGYQAGAVRAYYQGYDTIARLCKSTEPALRQLYDDLYQFHKGAYKRRRPYQPLPIPRAQAISPEAAGWLVDGLWSTRPDSKSKSIDLTVSKTSFLFDFMEPRLAGDVRVHITACGTGPQRMALALSPDPASDSFEEVAVVEDVALRPEDGGGFAILHGPSRLTRKMRLDVEVKPGERVALDEILLLPAAHLLWGCQGRNSSDPQKETQCLTDGVMGGDKMVTWATGSGQVHFALPEEWYAGSLLVSFRRMKPGAFAPNATLLVSHPQHSDTSSRPADEHGVVEMPLNRPLQNLTLTLEDKVAGVVAVDEIALLPARNLAYGRPYTLDPPFRAKYPDTAGKELTDGELSLRGFADGKTIGWERATSVAIVLDTGDVRPVESVDIHVEGGGYAAVHFPKRAVVLVSEDRKRWIKAGECTSPPTEVVALDMDREKCLLGWISVPTSGVRGRYVKVLLAPEGWLMVSEVRVMSGGRNVGLGQPYFLIPQPTTDEKYGDNDARLADGLYSSPASGWGLCVGFQKADPTITVDLGAGHRIQTARLHLVGGGAGAVYFPRRISVSTSLDGQTWSAAGATSEHPAEAGDESITGFMGITFEPREARFVRFHLQGRNWTMTDEIEVFPVEERSRP